MARRRAIRTSTGKCRYGKVKRGKRKGQCLKNPRPRKRRR